MASEEKLHEAARKLLAQLALPKSDVDALFQKAVDDSYWRALVPAMGVLDTPAPDCAEEEPLSPDEETLASRHLAKHGYFQIRPFASKALVARMRACVETLRDAGWPPVFSYVYDEFWAILRTPSMVRFLSRQLGSDYVQSAPVWTYRVDPQARASGWSPHIDGSHNVKRLTVWIPLVDASTGNGCMYVIPQDRMPENLPANYGDWTSISRDELAGLLHSATPMPAAAGSVLGWNHGVIHWGGRATDPAATPRISIALEFIPAGAQPGKGETPTIGVDLPGMPVRLRVIGQALNMYERFEPSMGKYRELARMLIEQCR